jgi:O-antigen chain-terminating methyltransferase
MGNGPAADPKAEELATLIREIRDRVRARYPEQAAPSGTPLPDLLPVLHARDAAEGKVAAIGTVNPRPPGLLNNTVQALKRLAARALDWHVREQVQFNRATVACLDAILEAFNENNRALAAIGGPDQVGDLRAHWSQWRREWERRLAAVETEYLRSVAELQGAFQHRTSLLETSLRELVKSQHAEFTALHERAAAEIQKCAWEDLEGLQRRMWSDLEHARAGFERLIHQELRLVRQRAVPQPAEAPLPPPAPAAVPKLDYAAFAERFRGSAEYVREKQRFYIPHFAGCRAVLDIGCGRGEFLELMREAGIPARGIDLDAESVAQCRSKGLEAEAADLFAYLGRLPEASLDGVFCAHVVEHLPPDRLPQALQLAASRLASGGVLAIETPNPECLAIFATHFYVDPTHQRPVPPPLLVFYLEEFGMGRIEVHRLSPAIDSMPELASLPQDFRDAFFGALDYAVLARKL